MNYNGSRTPGSAPAHAKFVDWVAEHVNNFVMSKPLLEGNGYTVALVNTERGAKRLLQTQKLHAAIVDWRTSDVCEVVALILCRLQPIVPILWLTAYGQEPMVNLKRGKDQVLYKGGPIENILWLLGRD